MIENIEQSKNVLTVYDLKLNLIASGIDPYGLKPELQQFRSQPGLPTKILIEGSNLVTLLNPRHIASIFWVWIFMRLSRYMIFLSQCMYTR